MPRLSATALAGRRPDGPPGVTLRDAFATWTARPDLLASGRFGRDFVVETDATGRADPPLRRRHPRTRPDRCGPRSGSEGRFGSGTVGNLGAGALGHVVLPAALGSCPCRSVTNPLPGARRRRARERCRVRVAAPQAFRTQQRAVTAADYAVAAREHPGRGQRHGRRTVDRRLADDPGPRRPSGRASGRRAVPRRRCWRTSRRYRLAGFDVAVRAAQAGPARRRALGLRAARTRCAASVGQRVRAALSPVGPGGGPRLLPPRPVHLRHAALPVRPDRRGDGGPGCPERHAGGLPAVRPALAGRARPRRHPAGRHRGARAARTTRASPSAGGCGSRWEVADDRRGAAAGAAAVRRAAAARRHRPSGRPATRRRSRTTRSSRRMLDHVAHAEVDGVIAARSGWRPARPTTRGSRCSRRRPAPRT